MDAILAVPPVVAPSRDTDPHTASATQAILSQLYKPVTVPQKEKTKKIKQTSNHHCYESLPALLHPLDLLTDI